MASANVGSFDGRLVTLRETKNKQPRIVPLSEAGQQAIQTYLDWRRSQGEALAPERPLILSHHQGWEGERLSYHGIYFAVERIGELAGLPDLHPTPVSAYWGNRAFANGDGPSPCKAIDWTHR